MPRRFYFLSAALFSALGAILNATAVATAAPPPAAPPAAAEKRPDAKKRDEAARAALARVLPEVTFDGVGLSDVLDFLRDVTGANLFVNWRALEEAGIDRNAPVTARLRQVPFAKVLDVILKSAAGDADAQLGFAVDQGVITISTKAELALDVVSRQYDVDVLLAGAADRKAREATLLKLITGSIDPPSWKANGGAAGEVTIAAGSLTVVATEANQKLVQNLVTQLNALRQ